MRRAWECAGPAIAQVCIDVGLDENIGPTLLYSVTSLSPLAPPLQVNSMISLQKNFLFVHAPKTGGNSIQSILQQYSEDRIIPKGGDTPVVDRFEVRSDTYGTHKHSSLSDYRERIDPEQFNSLYKFAVVRNPWELMISFFFSPHRKVSEWDRDSFIKLVGRRPITASYFTLEENVDGPIDADLDFLMRQEHLADDFKVACEKIGIPHAALPTHNASKRDHYSKYYDDETIELVAQKYHREIEFGNYVYESQS